MTDPRDNWFREQVQKSIDDPRPSVSDDESRSAFAKRAADLRRSSLQMQAAMIKAAELQGRQGGA